MGIHREARRKSIAVGMGQLWAAWLAPRKKIDQFYNLN
jgi:hypothetical protein